MGDNEREPDAEAIKDEELVYGHDPLTREELDSKYVFSYSA
jgi:hypothetical protein